MPLDHVPACWPESTQASLARRILPDYLRLGPNRFASNADVELLVVRAGKHVLPVVYRNNDRPNRTADVCSPLNHYVKYPLEEIDRHGQGATALLGRSVMRLSSPFLRATRIEEVASVNNWLLATNPVVDMDRQAIDSLTTELCGIFPRRTILFRTINPTMSPELTAHAVACGYHLVASRTVFMLDPTSRDYRRSENVRRDRKLLRDGSYELLQHEHLTAEDMPRLAELYRLLYIDKHSTLNMDFTPLFFETAWRNRFLEFRALRADDRIDAFVAYFELDGLLTAALIGYDVGLPEHVGLYRRCVALLMEESRSRGLRMHFSAGASAFKHHRGARPSVEYDAVFDRHLPLYRRAGWRLLEVAGFLQHRKVKQGFNTPRP